MSNTKLLHLKIKIKTLAEEAKIIRLEELGLKDKAQNWRMRRDGQLPLPNNTVTIVDCDDMAKMINHTRQSIHEHRVLDVRSEARASQLAYAFLRGKDYLLTENNIDGKHNDYKHSAVWRRVSEIVRRFSNLYSDENNAIRNDNINHDLEKWRDEGFVLDMAA